MIIGIIIAMDKEFARVEALLEGAKTHTVQGKRFVSGQCAGHELILHQCGIGKTNAAVGTTLLVSEFHPEAIISTGVAGGASIELNVADVVVAEKSVYHDAYCGSETAYGQLVGCPEKFISDNDLVRKALSIDAQGVKVRSGLTVTGDWFVDTTDKMRSILAHFPEAMAVDMESAAIAHTCWLFGVRFVSFRIISDIPLKERSAEQYYNFWDTMADSSFRVTKAFIENI